ncbi:hypothetical protein MVEN_01482900 [Mycena venus]|uniref:Transmembrane protein n=1 Tax=Mycena venus TaxID=2733690 RepID=A0A8H7CTW6_9AGAR|nr:hypothetical protein MVEN_01482900 [Mycena venus]
MRRPGPMDSDDSAVTPFEVLAGQVSSAVGGQALTATQTATTALSTPSGFTRLRFQSPKAGRAVGGSVTTSLAVLPATPVNTLFATTTSVFTTTSDVATSISGKLTTVQSIIVTTSTGLVPITTTPTELTDQSSAPKSASSNNTAAIAGGVVVALGLSAGVILYCIAMHRLAAQQAKSAQEVRNPFDDSEAVKVKRQSSTPSLDSVHDLEQGLTRSDTVSTRQLYIADQLNNAREKVAELEEMSSLLLRSSRAASPRSASGTDHDPPAVATEEDEPAHTNGPELPRVQQVQLELERAIQQIEELNNRIRELETQRRSSWALGLSDELPPGYVE